MENPLSHCWMLWQVELLWSSFSSLVCSKGWAARPSQYHSCHRNKGQGEWLGNELHVCCCISYCMWAHIVQTDIVQTDAVQADLIFTVEEKNGTQAFVLNLNLFRGRHVLSQNKFWEATGFVRDFTGKSIWKPDLCCASLSQRPTNIIATTHQLSTVAEAANV